MANTTRSDERYGYPIWLVLCASYLLVFFHRVSPSVLALDMQDAFGIGGALLGLLGSAYFYPYALMQVPIGPLMDGWGARNTVAASLLVAAAGSALMGLAPGIAWAICGRFLVGVGVSAIYVATFKLLGEWFPPRRMTILGGIFMAVGGLGVFAAGPPLAFLSERFGWRSALVAVALFSVLMAVVDRLVIRDRPAAVPAARTRNPAARTPNRAPLRLGAAFREVLGAGRFWPLAAWGGLSAGVTFAIGGMWGAPYLQHVHGMSKARAGGYQSMFGLALLLGAPAIAALANRVGRKPVAVGGTSLQLLCLAVLAAFPRQVPGPALYPLFFCLYLAGNTNGPLGAVIARELFRPAIAGTAMGLVNFFPFLLGGLYQVLMGALLDRGGRVGEAYTAAGYRWIFLLGLASAALALAAALLIRETLPSSRRPAGGSPRPEMQI